MQQQLCQGLGPKLARRPTWRHNVGKTSLLQILPASPGCLAAWHQVLPSNGHPTHTVRHKLVQQIDLDQVSGLTASPYILQQDCAELICSLDKVEVTLQPPPTTGMICISMTCWLASNRWVPTTRCESTYHAMQVGPKDVCNTLQAPPAWPCIVPQHNIAMPNYKRCPHMHMPFPIGVLCCISADLLGTLHCAPPRSLPRGTRFDKAAEDYHQSAAGAAVILVAVAMAFQGNACCAWPGPQSLPSSASLIMDKGGCPLSGCVWL